MNTLSTRHRPRGGVSGIVEEIMCKMRFQKQEPAKVLSTFGPHIFAQGPVYFPIIVIDYTRPK